MSLGRLGTRLGTFLVYILCAFDSLMSSHVRAQVGGTYLTYHTYLGARSPQLWSFKTCDLDISAGTCNQKNQKVVQTLSLLLCSYIARESRMFITPLDSINPLQ
jgi:hypothetical protein